MHSNKKRTKSDTLRSTQSEDQWKTANNHLETTPRKQAIVPSTVSPAYETPKGSKIATITASSEADPNDADDEDSSQATETSSTGIETYTPTTKSVAQWTFFDYLIELLPGLEIERLPQCICVSHSETMAEIFPDWFRGAYTDDGRYRPYDLNMPTTLPARSAATYEVDTPITEHGKTLAMITGLGLKLAKIKPTVIYTAPEMRCVQTAAKLTEELSDLSLDLRIEPALSGWHNEAEEDASRHWMTPDQYALALHYAIDESYAPWIHVNRLTRTESARDYMWRLLRFFRELAHRNKDGTEECVILVGNPELYALAMGHTWLTSEGLRRIRSDKDLSRSCSICSIGIEHKALYRKPKPIMPFTRTLNDAEEKRNARREG
ncbi:ubiquitin associated and SH3 domain-containing protein B [Aphelenchoides avenae]|nr:ubiquitin associated and SH3 domain-containing protein B [Aphelenchus avenae]